MYLYFHFCASSSLFAASHHILLHSFIIQICIHVSEHMTFTMLFMHNILHCNCTTSLPEPWITVIKAW